MYYILHYNELEKRKYFLPKCHKFSENLPTYLLKKIYVLRRPKQFTYTRFNSVKEIENCELYQKLMGLYFLTCSVYTTKNFA